MAKKPAASQPSAPTDTDLAKLLGPAKRHWDALLASVREVAPKARVEWKFYKSAGPGGGWRCVVSNSKRNLVYLRPDEGGFLASFALSDEAIDAAEKAGLSKPLIQAIREGPKLPEGRAARIEVNSAATLKAAAALLAVKAAH
jgi:hypothetical protein